MIGTAGEVASSGIGRAMAPHGAVATDVVESMRRRIDRLGLDLTGLTVITEAATGVYAVTASIAALANARRVYAVARDTSRYGLFEDARAATLDLAMSAGVSRNIDVVRSVTPLMLGECDILTNSGHLRPITRGMIRSLPDRAVIALMFEAWEFRADDLDLAACRERGIRIAAVNERHPHVCVFAFLGPLCAQLLAQSGLPPAGRQVLLLCDNPFASFLEAGLSQVGARVTVLDGVEAMATPGGWDAVIIALDPARAGIVGEDDLARIAAAAPGAPVAQFWGDIDRDAAARLGLSVYPLVEPSRGHMGVLLSDLGFEPVVRLQAGGLRAAELVRRGAMLQPGGVAELL